MHTTRLFPSLEGLNNSLAQSDGELWPLKGMGIIYPGSAFVGVEFLPMFVFWA